MHYVINALENAENLGDIAKIKSLNLHQLNGDLKDLFSLYLGKNTGYRLLIKPVDEDGKDIDIKDISVLYSATNIVLIWEVSKHYE